MMTDINLYILDYENLPFILFFGILSLYALNGSLPGTENVFIGLGFFVIFFLISFIYPGGMGLGDVFYITVYSFLVGHPYWIFFLNSSYILALVGSLLVLKKGENFLKMKIPMGFFYGISVLITYVIKIYYKIEYI